MSSNQRTLFQSWGCSVPHRDQSKTTSDRRKTTSNRTKTTSDQRKTTSDQHKTSSDWRKTISNQSKTTSDQHKTTVSTSERADRRSLWGETTATPQHDEAADEDDDDVMLVAVFEAERSLQAGPEPGFDPSAGRVWIYPTNYPVRQYQLQICEAALLRNTLVCLPTGLGKTFIAAVLMYNYYRWFPAGKIVFMAPTKPLVAQQIQACYGVMGIPQQHMAELTGRGQVTTSRGRGMANQPFY